jgi:hypothetical protein
MTAPPVDAQRLRELHLAADPNDPGSIVQYLAACFVAIPHLLAVWEAQTWRPIESAPRDGTVIDLWSCGERVADASWGRPTYGPRGADGYAIPGWVVEDDYDCDGPVNNLVRDATHWRPLPATPSEDQPHE